MGEVGQRAFQGFLVREACVGFLVDGAAFCVSRVHEVHNSVLRYQWFGVTLGSLYIEAQGDVPCWRICMICLCLELVVP